MNLKMIRLKEKLLPVIKPDVTKEIIRKVGERKSDLKTRDIEGSYKVLTKGVLI